MPWSPSKYDPFGSGNPSPPWNGAVVNTWPDPFGSGNPSPPWNGAAPMSLSPSGITSGIVAGGQRISIVRATFSYKGPDRQLVVGWAVKPDTSSFSLSTQFNNGGNTIPDYTTWSGTIHVSNQTDWSAVDVSVPNCNMLAPNPNVGYPLRGGGTGNIHDSFETWIWLVDFTKIQDQVNSGQLPDWPWQERYFIDIGRPGNTESDYAPAFNLQSVLSPQAQNFRVQVG